MSDNRTEPSAMPASAAREATVVKVSRKAIPAGVKYEDYIIVYQQLLQWIGSIKITQEAGPVRNSELLLVQDQSKLQKYVSGSLVQLPSSPDALELRNRYLKVSHGKLAGAQRRVIQAMERIRRLKGETYLSPDSPTSRSAFEVHLKSTDLNKTSHPENLPEPDSQVVVLEDPELQPPVVGSTEQAPTSNAFKGFSVQMESISAPVVPLSAGIELDQNGKLSVKIEFGSPTTSMPSATQAAGQADKGSPAKEDDSTKVVEDEQRGIATLLAMRRNKNGDSQAVLPTPLLSQSLKTTTGSRGAIDTGTSPRRYTSHAYYRSERVRNSQTPASSSVRQPATAGYSHLPASSGLPRAMHELHLRQEQDASLSPMPESAARGSPRIYIAPPHTAGAARPIRHMRTASAGQMQFIPPPPATPTRRFIPPPPGSARVPPASPARRYIHPPMSLQSLHRTSLPRSPPRYHPYAEREELPSPSPLKESFLRRAIERSPSPVSSGQDAFYQPCGTVQTRRRRSNERMESIYLANPYVRPPAGGRSISDQPMWHRAQHARTPSNGSDTTSSRKRAYEEPEQVLYHTYKRSRSESGSDAESGSSRGGATSTGRRFIPPPQIVPAHSVMPASRPIPRPASPPVQAPSPHDVKPQVSQSQIPNTTADLLSALLEEVKDAGKENGGLETAKALENVATTLAQVAQKLRRAK